MILKLNIKELVGVTPPATPSFNASADEYSDEVRISLEIGGVVIYSGLIKDFTYTYDAASFTQ